MIEVCHAPVCAVFVVEGQALMEDVRNCET